MNKLITYTDKLLTAYTANDLIFNISLSIVFLLGIHLFKKWYIKKLHADELPIEDRRKKLVSFRNTTVFLIIAGMTFLWASEIKTFTVSLVAIAVALVVATKEIILSLIGGILRTTSVKYTIGDRIEIKNLRGHVIDSTLLYTTIMEIGPKNTQLYTGRTVSFPNSWLLSDSIIVESFKENYTTHSFQIPVYPETADITDAAQTLKTVADHVCADYLNDAQAYVEHIQTHKAIDMPSHLPRVLIHVADNGDWWLTLRIVTPTREKIKTEQEILTQFLNIQKLKEVKK